ncbi:hypothetical protein [Novosphingobium sp. 9U]|uniref:hypothetical protein n=1 Tax=Novosphingobium sp. 9U TaxID=2653158 RepID=UPI0012F0A4E9|nr:hypothetical protein [Novosphingobium sp. 9U]VWX53199.1 conserved hypothetical protein [Novosphingobium sp. 9U]
MADAKRRKPAASPPITSHPLFPVTVVLWFGALFGLTSVAIRTGLIEHAVLVTGIDRVIPMAAPPLGTTTRILLALMMTAIGCLVGLLVARRLAKPAPQAVARRRRSTTSTAAADDGESPVALFGAARQAELADEPDDDAEEPEHQPATRRRQLAVIAQEERFDDHAPVPGASPILNVADLEIESFDAALDEEVWIRRSEPLQLAPREHAEAIEAEPMQAETTQAEHSEPEEPKPANRLFDAYVRAAPVRTAEKDDVPTPGFELLPREDEIVGAEPAVIADEPVAHTIDVEEVAAPARDMTAAERIASAPLDTLSHLELLERLALTIARRRAANGQTCEPTAAIEAPEMPLKPPAKPVLDLPVGLRAVPTDPHDDALPGYLPPRHIGRSDDDALDAGYVSLRSLTRPALAETGENTQGSTALQQSDSNTAWTFDAPTAAGDRTEQALRAALATLQRMSGAA